MFMSIEKQNLLVALSEGLADCDRGVLHKVAHTVMQDAWPSVRKRVMKGLLEADIVIDDRFAELAATCRAELSQERQDERARLEKRAETTAKQSESARKRHEIEKQAHAMPEPKPTPTSDAARFPRPTEQPRQAPPSAPRERDPDTGR
jgi:hypothetical protein